MGPAFKTVHLRYMHCFVYMNMFSYIIHILHSNKKSNDNSLERSVGSLPLPPWPTGWCSEASNRRASYLHTIILSDKQRNETIAQSNTALMGKKDQTKAAVQQNTRFGPVFVTLHNVSSQHCIHQLPLVCMEVISIECFTRLLKFSISNLPGPDFCAYYLPEL